MPNILNSANPDIITLDRDDRVWQYPVTPDLGEDNPAAQARAEYEHSLYVDALANDAREEVNPYETVPAAGEMTGYATNNGNVVDPAHAAAVVAEAQAVVANAFAASPDALAAQRAEEERRQNREKHDAAVAQAGVYAPRLEDMRARALFDWGADSES